MDIKKDRIKKELKEHRWDLLKASFIYALIIGIITYIMNRMGFLWLGIIFIFPILHIYLSNVIDYVKANDQVLIKSMLQIPAFSKDKLFVTAAYIVWGLFAAVVLSFVRIVPQLAPLFLVVLFVILVLTNFVNLNFAFDNHDKHSLQDYFDSLKVSLKDTKALLFLLIRTLSTTIRGLLFVFLFNVFIFGPQIQEALLLNEKESAEIIKEIFSKDLSNFVQMVGIQLLVLYILIMSAIIVYERNKESYAA